MFTVNHTLCVVFGGEILDSVVVEGGNFGKQFSKLAVKLSESPREKVLKSAKALSLSDSCVEENCTSKYWKICIGVFASTGFMNVINLLLRAGAMELMRAEYTIALEAP